MSTVVNKVVSKVVSKVTIGRRGFDYSFALLLLASRLTSLRNLGGGNLGGKRGLEGGCGGKEHGEESELHV